MGTVINLISDAAVELSLQSDWSTAFGGQDEGDTSLAKLRRSLHKTCQQLSMLNWEATRSEHVFTTVDGETQTAWKPADFLRLIAETLRNRSSGLEMYGPMSADDWQAYKAGWSVPAFPSYYIRGGDLLIANSPGAGQSISYEYISNRIGTNAADAPISRFAADTDVPLWDDELIILGIIANYRQIARMEYASDMQNFQLMMTDRFKADGGVKIYRMGGARRDHTVNELRSRVISIPST